MAFFLIFFIAAYTSINFYFFRKVQLAWPGNLPVLIPAGIFCLLMVFAPIFVRPLERAGDIGAARVFAWVGHT